MDEPLLCWIFLLLAIAWGSCTRSQQTQEALKRRCGMLTPLVQWYNVTFVLLFLLFLRTLMDIFKFEYIQDRFLSWEVYSETLDPSKTGIPLSPAELDTAHGPLVIPSWIRFLSLASPIAGVVAFGYSAYQVVSGILFGTNVADAETPGERFLHMVVRGMPLVYIVMALRATIRQWAVMTGSCWLPYAHVEMTLAERQQTWKYLKAAEISTYTQDLEVASGFQFFAVWCFGQVCSKALRRVLFEEGLRLANSFNQQAEPMETDTNTVSRDGTILLQLGILGLHSFVILGVVKTVFNMIIAMCSANWKLEAMVEPFQQVFLQTFDPVFVFATILSVINMLLLGKMEMVEKVLPNVNMKFNATRALLLIGQGQLTVLRAATTDGDTHTSKFLSMLHKIPFAPFNHMEWWFDMNQARLVHSSLLCFECLAVVIFNDKMWTNKRQAQAREAAEEGDPRRAPLLDC